MQGVGNDFVVVDGRDLQGLDWSGLSREMCDRKFGIGADGLLVIDRSHIADAMMRMYNPDGTPDVCGNGLRCVARFLADAIQEAGGGRQEARLTIATLAGIRAAVVGDKFVKVEMGEPKFRPLDIPMRVPGEQIVDYPLDVQGSVVAITALSTGTTHSVALVDSLPEDEQFFKLSPAMENHPLFPDRTSVMWAQVEDDHSLRLRIWERGAGETLGCGTGACAAAVAATIHGLTQSPVAVHSKGGCLTVEWSEGSPIMMTGPAKYVYTGEYRLDR